MENVNNCNLCGTKDLEVFLDRLTSWEHKGVFTLVRCKVCNLVFLNPRPSKKTIRLFYPDENYWGWDTKGNTKKLRVDSFKPLYNLIFNLKKTGKILDIGTGSGLFLTEFADRKWIVGGTEISKFAAGIALKKNKIKVKLGDFLNLEFKNNFYDVVTLNNVLEHIYRPKQTLAKAYKILKNDGLLVVTVPNIDSFGFKIFKKNWHPLQPPRHLYHFTTKTLTLLMETAGFEVKGILFNYKAHSIYALFESFRFKFSPRFKKRSSGGLYNRNYVWMGIYNIFKRDVGILLGYLVAYSVFYLEILFQKSETITIYATKK